MYIKLIEGIPTQYTLSELLKDNPGTSFPAILSDELLQQFDIFPVTILPAPAIDEKTQKIQSSYELIDGSWCVVGKIVEKTQTEIDVWLDFKASEVRAERNRLLAETDFYALVDNTMSIEMAEYRKELRDVSLQRGFPDKVAWPIKPNS